MAVLSPLLWHKLTTLGFKATTADDLRFFAVFQVVGNRKFLDLFKKSLLTYHIPSLHKFHDGNVSLLMFCIPSTLFISLTSLNSRHSLAQVNYPVFSGRNQATASLKLQGSATMVPSVHSQYNEESEASSISSSVVRYIPDF